MFILFRTIAYKDNEGELTSFIRNNNDPYARSFLLNDNVWDLYLN